MELSPSSLIVKSRLRSSGDALPGPYYITPGAINFPPPEQLRETQQKIYAWYHAHAASRQLARVYAEALT